MSALVGGGVAKGGFKNVDVPNRIVVVNNSDIIIDILFSTRKEPLAGRVARGNHCLLPARTSTTFFISDNSDVGTRGAA